MIIGIGTDIIDITRIEKVINRFGDRFKNRVFTSCFIDKYNCNSSCNLQIYKKKIFGLIIRK